MITPLEIENKKFSKQMMNGYSVEEVDDFLDDITACYEQLYKEKSENIDSIAYCILYLFHDSILIQKTAKYTLL